MADTQELPPSCGPASGLSNEDLVSVALESYGRSFIYPSSKVNHNRWVECRAELLSRLARTPPPPAVDSTVESALAQLREWFPDEEIGVDLRVVRGNAKGTYDAAEILLVHAEQYFDGNSLAKVMQKVREWKEQRES